MRILRIITSIFLVLFTTFSFGQSKDWSKDEQEYYKTIKSLGEYFKDRTYDTTQRSFVFKEFVYFDNILNDTSQNRIIKRIEVFDVLFSKMELFIDSIGVDNLDAIPTRFFKGNTLFFEPFGEGGELNELLPLTLTYFDKRKPNEPMGAILFEPKTHKILAWLMVNQGGYRYFLTFNLV